jgi:hypothetical protein
MRMIIQRTVTCSVFTLIAACSGISDQTSEPTAEKVAQLSGPYQLYLRCNATSWDLNATSKLQPTADPAIYTLDYQVTQSWMVSGNDNCFVTDNTTTYTDYGQQGTTVLSVPSLGQATRSLYTKVNQLAVKYPSLGFYHAIVNWTNHSVAIQRVKNQTYLYMRLRFSDDAVGYTPQGDSAITSEVEGIKQKFYRWANGQLSVTTALTPTLDLVSPHAHYVTGQCDANGYPEWTGMDWLMSDALTAASAKGYNTAAYNVHSVRYDGEPGCCCNWALGLSTWVRADGYEAHEWGHNLGLPDEGAFRSKTSQPLNPDREYEEANAFSGMHNPDVNAFYSVPDMRDLGILDDTNLIRPTATGTYRIYTHTVEPVGLVTGRKYAIELTNAGQALTFEYRTLVPSNVDATNTNGLLIFDSDDNELVDATPRSKSPASADLTDAALQLNTTLSSWDGKWTIKPTAKGGSGNGAYLDVKVTFTGK